MAYFYILRLKSGSLYIGVTGDLKRRYAEHRSGRACRTTKVDAPVGVSYTEKYADINVAKKRERQVKKWSRAKKEALVRGDKAELRRLSESRE